MIRRPPRSTRTDTLFPTRRSSDLPLRHRVRGLSRHVAAVDRRARHAARSIGTRRLQTLCLRELPPARRSEEHTSELQSLMRISYAVFCLKKKKNNKLTDNQKLIKDIHKTNAHTS